MKSSGIGGQAVLEGVMMKNKDCYAVAVRKPNNEIEVKKEKFNGAGEKAMIFRLPIFRGVAAFVESLVLGMRTLTYSSGFYEEEEEQKEVSKAKETLVDIGVVSLSLVMAVAIFILFPLFISSLLAGIIESETLQLVIEGFLRLFMFIAYIAIISRLNDIKRVFMYHGAEHKCINCVEQGYELTIANVKKQSKCHKRCGTSFMLVVMLVSFMLFMFIRVDAAWLRYILRIVLIPVIAGVSYEFIRLAGNTDNKVINFLSRPGFWMQGLTTKEPDDSMIEVAIASVEAVFDWRAYQEKEGIAKYQKVPYGRKEKTGLPVSKGSQEEKTASSSSPEGRVAAGPSRKESAPVARSARNEEKPVAKGIRREEKPAIKGSIKGENPVVKPGLREEKTAARAARPEKALPKGGVKTIKPIAKVDNKAEKAAADALIRKEKAVIKNTNKGTKAAAKGINQEIKALPKDGKKDKKMKAQSSGQESLVKDEKTVAAGLGQVAAINEENAGRPMQAGRERPSGKTEERLADARRAAAEKEEAAVDKIQEIAISEENMEELPEAMLGREAEEKVSEAVVGGETAEKVPETAPGRRAAEGVLETAPNGRIAEEILGTASNGEILEDSSEAAIAEEAAAEIPAAQGSDSVLGAGRQKEAQNEPKNREQARRRNDLINFMAAPDDDEEDEILRALDRYFVYEEENTGESK